jgi:hypothetical protein
MYVVLLTVRQLVQDFTRRGAWSHSNGSEDQLKKGDGKAVLGGRGGGGRSEKGLDRSVQIHRRDGLIYCIVCASAPGLSASCFLCFFLCYCCCFCCFCAWFRLHCSSRTREGEARQAVGILSGSLCFQA